MVTKFRLILIFLLFSFVVAPFHQADAISWKFVVDSVKKNKTTLIAGVVVCGVAYFVYRLRKKKSSSLPSQPTIKTSDFAGSQKEDQGSAQAEDVDPKEGLQKDKHLTPPHHDEDEESQMEEEGFGKEEDDDQEEKEEENEHRDTADHLKSKRKTERVTLDPPMGAGGSSTDSLGQFLGKIRGHFINIENNLARVNGSDSESMVCDQDFELIGEIQPDELRALFEKDLQSIQRDVATITNVLNLERKIEELQAFVANATKLQEDVACITLCIAGDDTALKQNVTRSLRDLERTGVSIGGAYEVLGLDRKNRDAITIPVIEARWESLSEKGGKISPKGMKVRQAGFILHNKHSKLLYDRFLDELVDGKEGSLSILRIPPEDVVRFNIDFAAVSQRLMTLKQLLETVHKQHVTQLKCLSEE